MKKLLYFSMAILALVSISCNKQEVLQPEEENTPTEQTEQTFTPLVISAVVDDDVTKTEYTYNENKYEFKWSVGDKIAVQLYTRATKDDPTKSVDLLPFSAACTQASASTYFVQDAGTFDLTDGGVTGSPYTKTGYVLGDYAFYPKQDEAGGAALSYWGNGRTTANDYIRLTESIPYISTKPMSVIPMIGKKEAGSDGTPNADYHFKPVTGVLKLTINNIPSGATKLVLKSNNNSDQLSGYWYLTDNSYNNGIVMGTDDYSGYTYSTKTITFTGLDGQNVDFYVPIPIGTIHGLFIELQDDSDHCLFRVSTDAEIPIARSVVKSLTAINCNSSATVSMSGAATAPVINYNQSVGYIFAHVSASATNNIAEYNYGLHLDEKNAAASFSDLATFDSGSLLPTSGKYYLHYIALANMPADADALHALTLTSKLVKAYGTIPFYYITEDDATAVCKTYTAPTAAECTSAGSSTTPAYYYDDTKFSEPASYSMTVAISNNPCKGSIMVTSFAGVSGSSYGLYKATATYPMLLYINEPFCKVNSTNYYLREYYNNVGTGDGQDVKGTARFKINGIYYGGVQNGIACWGSNFGLYANDNTNSSATTPGIKAAPFFTIEP